MTRIQELRDALDSLPVWATNSERVLRGELLSLLHQGR